MSDLDVLNADWIKHVGDSRRRDLAAHEVVAGMLTPAVERGGPGSGHFGHEGRPGEVGGSQPGGGIAERPISGVSSAAFREASERALQGSPYSAHVNHYTETELAEMKTLVLSVDGRAGVAIKDHGDGRIEATGLFNQRGGPPGQGMRVLRYAISNEGVNYVECFGNYLPKLYARLGFEVDERFPFDPDQAPAGWNQERFDEPDYFTMRLPAP
jgi:hypothetical protein